MVRPRCVLEMENSPPLLLLRKGRGGYEERQRKVVGEGRGGEEREESSGGGEGRGRERGK